MLVKKSYVILLLFMLSTGGSAGQTIIRGKAAGRQGQYAVLFRYPDLITYTPERLDSAMVRGDDTFEIIIEEQETFYGFILIDDASLLLYVVPDNAYEVTFPIPWSERDAQSQQAHAAEITAEHPLRLNALTGEVNAAYNTYLQENYALILQHKAAAITDTFANKLKKTYKDSGNAYLLDFVNYTCAELQQATFSDADWIFDYYLHAKKVKYLNTAYMNFMLNFYGKTLMQKINENSQSADELKRTINEKHSIPLTLDAMGGRFSKEDEELKELVLLIGLYKNYGNPALDTKAIRFMLDHAASKSKYPQQRLIAQNMLKKLTRLSPGSPAPGFALYDKDSNLVRLEDFKGKFVYLDFWATWCKPCMSEMKFMPELLKKYGKNFVFVSISLDRNIQNWRTFIDKHPDYKWVFLHYGNDKNMQEKYNIKGIPLYYLIDPEGKFLLSPALRPSENIGEVMRDISRKLEPKKRW